MTHIKVPLEGLNDDDRRAPKVVLGTWQAHSNPQLHEKETAVLGGVPPKYHSFRGEVIAGLVEYTLWEHLLWIQINLGSNPSFTP